MNDLATFIVINTEETKELPEDVMEVLKRNGWMVVKEGTIFVLPWQKILEENGGDPRELLTRVEDVRLTLKKLKVSFSIRTMGKDKMPT